MTQDRIDDILDKKKYDEPIPVRTRLSWEATLRTRDGRRVATDILSMCHFGLSAFEGDVDMCVFTSGKQKVGEEVMNMINSISPETYHLMMKEQKEDQEHDRNELNSGDGSISDTSNT